MSPVPQGVPWDETGFAAALERLEAEGTIDARGRRVTSEMLERILAAASAAERTLVGDFTHATFEDGAVFTKATFSGVARFTDATFEGVAEFTDATFGGGADFDDAKFDHGATFTRATFQDYADFKQAIFKGDADFTEASMKEAIRLGPMLVCEELKLDRASFGRIEIQVSAARLSCHRTQFHDSANTFVLWADVLLDGATFERPSLVAWLPDFEFDRPQRPRVDRCATGATEGPPDLPRIVSLRLASVENLTLSDADLRACRFAGAHGLDRLRTERCTFAETPWREWRWTKPWPLPWRWTRRETLAEEHEWRAAQTRLAWRSRLTKWRTQDAPVRREDCGTEHQSGPAGSPRWADWDGSECESPTWLREKGRFLKLEQRKPKEIASIYRALRKEREDSKNEPGAADFYYGEMEMRRHSKPHENDGETAGTRWSIEHAILTLYWLVSGYGLRASRALLSLTLCIFLFAALFSLWGIQGDASFGDALIFSVQSTTSLFRAPVEDLSAGGKLLEVGLRLLGPLFFGLALLSLRGRVRR